MGLSHYPNAILAADIVSKVAARRAAGEVIQYGYECLYISPVSTRPSMEFSLHAKDLNAPDWHTLINQIVQRAIQGAKGSEEVFYDPD